MRMGSAIVPALIACLLLSCTGPRSSDDAGATSRSPRTTSATPSQPHASRSPGTLPGASSAQPAAFAHELDRTVATLRNRRSTPAEVRQAAQYQQLAVR